MKTAMQELKNDILIEIELGLISEKGAYRILDYIDSIYIEQEKEQMFDLIHFMRTNDKMGKTVDDLYNEFINQNK